jgi:hypothetical protein
MKTIQVNGTPVVCSHEVKTDEKQHTSIHVKVKAGDIETVHVMTIGALDSPLAPGYDAAALQKDLDAFRESAAVMAESKMRAKTLAQGLV